jgi:hypothetical protein
VNKVSKDYLCKDCEYNNNGWCKKKEFNGLKKITECGDKKVEGYLSEQGQQKYNSIVDEQHQDINYEEYKNMGKREIFHTIQQQLNAMKNTDTVLTVKQIMVNLEQLLLIGEKVHGIKTEYIIDEDIFNHSKFISAKWLKEVGGYKGDEEIL